MPFYRYRIRWIILGAFLSASTIFPFTAVGEANSTSDLTISQHQSEDIKQTKPRKKKRRNSIDNRHQITDPTKNPGRWLNTMKRTRVKELFLTKQGLPGHVMQVQNEINRLRNQNPNNLNTWASYKTTLKELKYSLISSAKGANFDFKKTGIMFSPLESDLYLERRNGKLFVNGRPAQ
ncbi:MAG: hypothetical protein IGS23_15270 [Rivularia sp. T60_A2020_040]|nr:hypothetical protein [Rivularia sp. T60_A2020_040]